MIKKDGIIIPDSAVDKQTLNFKDSDALVILAKGDSWRDGAKIAADLDCECWGLNDCERIPEMTMLFELHDWDKRCKDYNPVHLETKLPVMMKERYPDVPNSVKFPMNALLEEFGVHYYNNQVCQMLAFAIHTKRFKRIYLFGVDYAAVDRVEQEFERPCTEFWIGFALSRGIHMFVAQQSTLMTYVGYHKGIVYGYTPDYQKPFKGFREAYPHYTAEYILGAFGGQQIDKRVYDHDDWFEKLSKFATRYVHDQLVKSKELQDADAKEAKESEVSA